MDYKEQLKDGRWQLKRSIIMERDKFTCRVCGSKAKEGHTLNVHHIKYIKNRMPWEYKDEELVTLCEKCHHAHHTQSNISIFDIKIGTKIHFDHSDYTDYGIIYYLDLEKMEGRIACIDDGSDYSMLWLLPLKIREDGSLSTYQDRDVSLGGFEFEDNFWGECMIDCLSKVCKNYENENTSDYYFESWMDEMEELFHFRENYDLILNNNPGLSRLISIAENERD